MSRTIPLWRSPEISLHRFDHPAEHEDQPYEETAGSFRASAEKSTNPVVNASMR